MEKIFERNLYLQAQAFDRISEAREYFSVLCARQEAVFFAHRSWIGTIASVKVLGNVLMCRGTVRCDHPDESMTEWSVVPFKAG